MTEASPCIDNWLDGALAAGDFVTAEQIANTCDPDFSRVYALLKIAGEHSARGHEDKAEIRARQAVTVWRLGCDQWWYIPMLGDLLRRLVEIEQLVLAGEVQATSARLPDTADSPWIETLAMCGLAQGAFWLENPSEAKDWFVRAAAVARNRSTDEERTSSITDVVNALKAIGWFDLAEELFAGKTPPN